MDVCYCVEYAGTSAVFDDSYEQGLEEKIQLVPIDLQDRPAWYKEKVYPANKVKF